MAFIGAFLIAAITNIADYAFGTNVSLTEFFTYAYVLYLYFKS